MRVPPAVVARVSELCVCVVSVAWLLLEHFLVVAASCPVSIFARININFCFSFVFSAVRLREAACGPVGKQRVLISRAREHEGTRDWE